MLAKQMEEYKECAYITSLIDYGEMETVERSNRAVERMYEIVSEIASQGSNAINKFAELLEHQPSATWLAHQLVEKATLDKTLLQKCFAIVEKLRQDALANGQGATALGEEWWLKEWKQKKRGKV
jgi:uncharacterized membrane protein YgaE (UPF0421/DUF939 family)